MTKLSVKKLHLDLYTSEKKTANKIMIKIY